MKRPRAAQAYRLFGLIAARSQRELPRLSSARAERFEDIAAVVAEHPDGRSAPAPEVERHRAVVAEVFAQCAILPAPPGTVFRSMGVLRRWLELHHTALLGGLAYIDGRAEARVHIRRIAAAGSGAVSTAPGRPTRPAAVVEHLVMPPAAGARDGAGFEATAARIFHELGKDQAAWVVQSGASNALPGGAHSAAHSAMPGVAPGPSGGSPIARDAGEASASFLVDRSRWRAFADAVSGEEHRDPDVEVRLTGPWPPYDFVRLQFGG